MNGVETGVAIVQTVVVVAGFIYTVRAIRESSDARNIDFVINAEGQVDPLFVGLMGEEPEVIRAVLPQLIPQGVGPLETKVYAYTYFGYRHLSRIIYMLSNQNVSLGMSSRAREDFLEDWLNEVKKYDQDVLRTIHGYCRTTGEFNDTFIALMDRRYPSVTAPDVA